MNPLDKPLHNTLEKTVKDARRIAEHAAKAALDQLGVGEPAPFAHLIEAERVMRRRLRVHGRQLGDTLNGGKDQTMDRLMEEVAYQHWHRMLFARFLAENNLLMYPDPDDPVAVTLEECEDLAPDEGAVNGWELAARYAAQMLPQIFRLDSPVFELTLPPEHQQKLERLVADLPLEVFTASDAIGWVYQFWQARKKEEVNASEKKIGARELPAVTQLFTEPYMVSFLLDNSLGAWWVKQWATGSGPLSDKAKEMLKTAKSEEELRQFFSRPGIPLTYLRFVKTGTCTLAMENRPIFDGEHWMPAAGWFDRWPKNLCDLKTLDPCCGSGHFLVATLLMLVPMRMELENLSAREAVDVVLKDNIHGLEIDRRCVELAAFALALTAWKYSGAGGYRILPELNVACSGMSISAKKEAWLAIAEKNANLRIALENLYKQFKDAPVLGSLINPEASLGNRSLFELKWEDVRPQLTKALPGGGDDTKNELAIVARGLTKVAEMATIRFELITTNVPFLTQSRFSHNLKNFIYKNYAIAKENLATTFIIRMLAFTSNNGILCFVSPQSWWFLKRYSGLRLNLIEKRSFKMLVRLGEKAFESAQAAGEIVGLTVLGKEHTQHNFDITLYDVSNTRDAQSKANSLVNTEARSIRQAKQIDNKDHALHFEEVLLTSFVADFSSALQGLVTGDSFRFFGKYWEQDRFGNDWEFLQTTSPECTHYGGMTDVILWQRESGELAALAEYVKGRNHSAQNWRKGKPNWGKPGVVVSQMGSFPTTLYKGNIYDHNCCAVVPNDTKDVLPLWCFCTSKEFYPTVRSINQNRKIEVGTILNIPIDLEAWRTIAVAKYPNGLPKPYTDDPTQWIFHGYPCGSVIWDEDTKWTTHGPLRDDDSVLHVAVARLLGYRWPAELDPDMELADEQREWVNRCQSLLPFADEDGIVCIPPVRGEAPATDRLLNLLAAAYGDAWSNDLLARLLKNANHAGKTLETWLRDKFFIQHCKLFKHRPFIWHIWDGLRDGFAALVNYHKLDTKRMETLIYTYLGDWINRQKQGIIDEVDGAQERLDAAESLMKKLELILEGEAPYDIFVRWKTLDQQPIGWDPDLNDGVRLNIRPSMSVPDIRKKGAGVLRDKPNIKWTKDRGKDVESAPWYPLFKGDRINDHHLTLSEKRTAREQLK